MLFHCNIQLCYLYEIFVFFYYFMACCQVMEYRRVRYKKALARSPDITGPGEDGAPVHLTAEEQAEADKLFAKETFNVIASNKVALDRRIRDNRHPQYDSHCLTTV